ncbi:MAG: site-2 protease family protein [Verrucomicrobiae bacterium]|nr:site-2 protease family protein [Verrucomicrobiae bacterium]
MRWSIKIARIAGIDVKLHVTFILFLAWIGFTYYMLGGLVAMFDGLILVSALFGCVLLHEFGHALAARSFGIRTPDITLLPIGGVARMLRIPDKPHEELIMAVSGPVVNFIIAGVLVFVFGSDISWRYIENIDEPGINIVGKIATVNIMLAMFNLIPAFPMDGGRVLRAMLAMLMDYSQATKIAAWIGQGLAFVFALVGLFFNPMLIFIALFVYLGASQEASMVHAKSVSSDMLVSEAMMTRLMTLPAYATINEAVEALLRTSQHEFPVLDEYGRVLGILTRDGMITALKQGMENAYVIEFMQKNLPYAMPYEPFEEAYRKMQECGCAALPVVNYDGKFVGLITPENIAELFMVKSLKPDFRRQSWQA